MRRGHDWDGKRRWDMRELPDMRARATACERRQMCWTLPTHDKIAGFQPVGASAKLIHAHAHALHCVQRTTEAECER